MGVPTDPELFIRQAFDAGQARQGCDLLFRRYYSPLCSHAVRFLYDRQAAEDLVADLFLQVYTRQLYQTITGSYRAYLFTAVRNRALNYLRDESSGRLSLDEAPDFPDIASASPDQLLQQDDLYAALESAIQQLPLQRRRVFMLGRYEGKKYQEIADEMNLSVKTVEHYMHYALATLRAVLNSRGLLRLLVGLGIVLMKNFPCA